MISERERASSLIKELKEEVSWPKEKLSEPVVLLLGGFQGSGKTTVIEAIKEKAGLVVVSKDEIRQRLIDKGQPINREFGQMVDEVARQVLVEAVGKGCSAVLDTNAVPEKIEKVKKWLEGKGEYRLVTVFLEVDEETLKKRIKKREPVEGRYQGKVGELKDSLSKWGEIDKNRYDVVIDSGATGLDEVKQMVLDSIIKV